ncbi:MAG: type IV toxin-antitoxin system AbiEi family antitoxin domain-containing protein [Cyanobacteria bacterium HKST-UBA02]|nr:type IV toxin-antitoxin system AbiEi family antitoxin domain-containing protein [Cyanobacteria bacterium HKST-UBA02]
MRNLDQYLDEQLARGRYYFSKDEAIEALGVNAEAFTAAATRYTRKRRIVSPRRGFYLILRPEDRVAGAPDPVRWIDPLMKFLKLDYRVSLLRAAAFHGSSHQAAMVFQVIVPKQLRSFDIGRHRIQFIYQAQETFVDTNQPEWLQQLKSETGFAKVAGVELALLDSIRYYHKAGGINGAAQIVHDIGSKASPRKLARAAALYENSTVRRLGYLLDHFGLERQSRALVPFTKSAKSIKPLDPSLKPLMDELPVQAERDGKWMLAINESVDIDL